MNAGAPAFQYRAHFFYRDRTGMLPVSRSSLHRRCLPCTLTISKMARWPEKLFSFPKNHTNPFEIHAYNS